MNACTTHEDYGPLLCEVWLPFAVCKGNACTPRHATLREWMTKGLCRKCAVPCERIAKAALQDATKPCEACGRKFIFRRKSARYCSPACVKRGQRERQVST